MSLLDEKPHNRILRFVNKNYATKNRKENMKKYKETLLWLRKTNTNLVSFGFSPDLKKYN